MMEITRNVIEDLLPLYLANEASADTRTLVDEYLKTDPELAGIAKDTTMIELPKDIPISLTKEDKMEAYKEAKRLMLLRTVILAAIISSSLIVLFLLWLLAFRMM
jgi:hypothetical protein